MCGVEKCEFGKGRWRLDAGLAMDTVKMTVWLSISTLCAHVWTMLWHSKKDLLHA